MPHVYAREIVIAQLMGLRRSYSDAADNARTQGLVELAALDADCAAVLADLVAQLTGQRPTPEDES